MDRATASQLRQRIVSLRQERQRLEDELLQAHRLLRGSLLARYLCAGGQRRRTAAYYLSLRREDGAKRLVYIRKADLPRARREVEAYRRYRKILRRLRAVAREVLETFKALGRSQEVSPPS